VVHPLKRDLDRREVLVVTFRAAEIGAALGSLERVPEVVRDDAGELL
jgi:hypothetical protein